MTTHWQQLHSALEHLPATYGMFVPKPREASLDEVESSAHFRLSKSYREFIKVFGPRTLGGVIGIRGLDVSAKSKEMGDPTQ
jgi:hypothetical protein